MSTPEPIGEIDGVPQYAQATTESGATIVAATPPGIWNEGEAAEPEAGG
jgi:hypothetical protein